MSKRWVVLALAGAALFAVTSVALAKPPSGAIFTTTVNGDEVNFNHYASKPDVYLDGGPGEGAPQTAAGLDDGTYVFQVTDPSGKVLLSTDQARCRQFTVSGGIITGVVSTGCQHSTGFDIDHGAATVQLIPYDDTPNNGGVYKVWVTLVSNYLAGCQQLGVSNGLDVVDPGRAPGNSHGFIPGDSIVEIDTRFFDTSGQVLDGQKVTWFDTNGATNDKWSYFAPQLQIFHEAHVEAIEAGVHQIKIDNPAGRTINYIQTPDGRRINGPGTVEVRVPNINRDQTIFIDVYLR
jgi:hypothetical protein